MMIDTTIPSDESVEDMMRRIFARSIVRL